MSKRMKVNFKKGKKLFTKTAQKVNRRNGYTEPMRGGIRL